MLTDKYSNADWFDAENCVANSLWGTKASTNIAGDTEYDFMHFQFPGHEALSSAIGKKIREMVSTIPGGAHP